MFVYCIFFFKQKTAYEMRISDWNSDVCSSDLDTGRERGDLCVFAQQSLGLHAPDNCQDRGGSAGVPDQLCRLSRRGRKGQPGSGSAQSERSILEDRKSVV